jgi:hypothetical protein
MARTGLRDCDRGRIAGLRNRDAETTACLSVRDGPVGAELLNGG